MIKIMIVDDMPIFLEYLRGFIDWESYGFEICCEAEDGREALEKMEQYQPDIVLTDITMPHMSGLELAEEIGEKYPDTGVVLITGNNEFEYARQAVKIGVCDYIIKPFEKEELLFTLLKFQDNIRRALDNKKEKQASSDCSKEPELRKLLRKETDMVLVRERLRDMGVVFENPYFLVCTMCFLVNNAQKFNQVREWSDIIVEMLEDKLKIPGSFQVFQDDNSNIVLILNFENEDEMKTYRIYELMDISKVIKSQLKLETVIGVSPCCYGLEHVAGAYQQAIRYEKKNGHWKSLEVTKMAADYIHEHFTEADLSVSDISRELFINQTYLRRMFKEEMGCTLSEYITKCRMETAKRLIENTNDKMSVVAIKSGYNDVSYFSKCFKKYYGVTPKKISR